MLSELKFRRIFFAVNIPTENYIIKNLSPSSFQNINPTRFPKATKISEILVTREIHKRLSKRNAPKGEVPEAGQGRAQKNGSDQYDLILLDNSREIQ